MKRTILSFILLALSFVTVTAQSSVSKPTTIGTTQNIVILVEYSDLPFSHTQAEMDSFMNQIGYSVDGATGSVKEYFIDNSYGQYSPVFDVVGPFTLDHEMSYYGGNNNLGSDLRESEMLLEAVRKADAAGVDFSKYDNNGDGYIDNVCVIFAGYGEQNGVEDAIWPSEGTIDSTKIDGTTSADFIFDGKILHCTTEQNELAGNTGYNLEGIGPFCHEFSHFLGFPDFNNPSDRSYRTCGYWDIMDYGMSNNNGKTPAGYSTFQRFLMGWVTPVVLDSSMTVQLSATLPNNGSASSGNIPQTYIITSTGSFNGDAWHPEPSEYFILENRQNNKWDAYLPGHGMLIAKIKWDSVIWGATGQFNGYRNNLQYDLIKAGEDTTFQGHSSDPFPGTSIITSYAPYSNQTLSNIAENDGIITFDFTGGVVSGVEDAEMGKVIMFSTDGEFYTVENIPENATLRCYDAMGRLLWSAENVGESYTFSNGREVFFLQVQAGGKVATLKGI